MREGTEKLKCKRAARNRQTREGAIEVCSRKGYGSHREDKSSNARRTTEQYRCMTRGWVERSASREARGNRPDLRRGGKNMFKVNLRAE